MLDITSYKVLKFIHRKNIAEKEDICNFIGDKRKTDQTIIYLKRNEYIVGTYRKIEFINGRQQEVLYSPYELTNKGKACLENHIENIVKSKMHYSVTIINTLIALTSLIISILAYTNN
jgi:hypothetical protein